MEGTTMLQAYGYDAELAANELAKRHRPSWENTHYLAPDVVYARKAPMGSTIQGEHFIKKIGPGHVERRTLSNVGSWLIPKSPVPERTPPRTSSSDVGPGRPTPELLPVDDERMSVGAAPVDTRPLGDRIPGWLEGVAEPAPDDSVSNVGTVDLFDFFFEPMAPVPVRRTRPVEDDPFYTDASFFRSGRYRPTGYAPGDRHRAPSFVPRREPRRGPYTGAAQCPGPKVFRKFGENTRARVMPFRRYTHMSAADGFANDVVGSQPVPPFLSPHATLGQSGSEAVLTAAHLRGTLGAGKPGATHPILDG